MQRMRIVVNANSWRSWLALLLAIFAIMFLRAPEMVLSPSLLVDDGPKVFAYFYEHREIGELLRFKSGYMPLVGNALGYLAVRLPPRVIPYGFVVPAILIATFSYALFFAIPFRRWIASDLQRAIVCLTLAFAPLSDCLLLTMSDYSLWNLFAALLLLAVVPIPQNRLWRFAYIAVCNVLVWSHPLTILVAPVVAWRAFRETANRNLHVVVLFSLALHQVFGVSGIGTMHGLWQRGHGGGLGVTQLWDACRWTPQIIAATAFRSAFGATAFQSFQHNQLLLTLWLIALVALACWVAWEEANTRPLLLYLSYVLCALTFACCFLRYEDVGNDPIAFINYSPRYTYIQSLAFLFAFAATLRGIVMSIAEASDRLRTNSAALASAALVLLMGYYALLNAQYGHYFLASVARPSPYYGFDPRNGLVVREFFDRLAKAEKERGSWRGIQLSCNKVADWPFSIDTTVENPSPPIRYRHRTHIITLAIIGLALCYFAYQHRRPIAGRAVTTRR